MTDNDVSLAFDELRPATDSLTRLVATAPLPDKQRGGLALLMAAHFVGLAMGVMRLPVETGAREVCDLIVATMRDDRPALRVVASKDDGEGT